MDLNDEIFLIPELRVIIQLDHNRNVVNKKELLEYYNCMVKEQNCNISSSGYKT